MIVPEKPLWGGNKNICMYVCTNPMNVGRPQKLGFFPKKNTRCPLRHNATEA